MFSKAITTEYQGKHTGLDPDLGMKPFWSLICLERWDKDDKSNVCKVLAAADQYSHKHYCNLHLCNVLLMTGKPDTKSLQWKEGGCHGCSLGFFLSPAAALMGVPLSMQQPFQASSGASVNCWLQGVTCDSMMRKIETHRVGTWQQGRIIALR